jgi:hypothetical protein
MLTMAAAASWVVSTLSAGPLVQPRRRSSPPGDAISPWLAVLTLLLMAAASVAVALRHALLIALVFGQA